jgi:hypothetical protein
MMSLSIHVDDDRCVIPILTMLRRIHEIDQETGWHTLSKIKSIRTHPIALTIEWRSKPKQMDDEAVSKSETKNDLCFWETIENVWQEARTCGRKP